MNTMTPEVTSAKKPVGPTDTTSPAQKAVTPTKTTVPPTKTTVPPTKTTVPPTKPRGVLHFIGVGISWGLLALMLMLAVMVIALPVLTRSTPYTVLTSSMTPSYPAGTLVIVKPTDTQQIHIGDVVTYQAKSDEPTVITHRVIQIIEPTKPGDTVKFVTKGDANSLPDPVVKPVQVRGVVWYAVPYIGWVNNVINGGSRTVIVPLVAGLLFLYAGYMAASSYIDRRRKAAAPVVVVDQEALEAELAELRELRELRDSARNTQR